MTDELLFWRLRDALIRVGQFRGQSRLDERLLSLGTTTGVLDRFPRAHNLVDIPSSARSIQSMPAVVLLWFVQGHQSTVGRFVAPCHGDWSNGVHSSRRRCDDCPAWNSKNGDLLGAHEPFDRCENRGGQHHHPLRSSGACHESAGSWLAPRLRRRPLLQVGLVVAQLHHHHHHPVQHGSMKRALGLAVLA
jgi:hypothetical protein